MTTLKDTSDLRRFLTVQIEAAASGKFDAERCRGIANLAQQIYNTLNVEVKMALVRSKLGADAKIEPVKLND